MDTKTFLSKLPSNIVPIVFQPGWRGHAFYRIFCAHSEVAWINSFSCTDEAECLTSLDFPETVSGFSGADDWSFKMAATAATCGIGFYSNKVDTNQWKNWIKQLDEAKQLDKLIPIHMHQIRIDISLINNKTVVWGYGKPESDFLSRLFLVNKTNLTIDPIEHSCVYNVNVPNLFSTDYNLFESEYIDLINYFDFKPQLNRVRAFILRYLERERHILFA